MYLIIGANKNDVLFYETKLKEARKEMILNKFEVTIGTLYSEEVMLISEVYSSYLTSAILPYIIEKYFVLLIIVVGRCQTFTNNLKMGEIIISKNTIFGDVDQVSSTKNVALGQIPGIDRFIESDLTYVQIMHQVFERIGLDTAKDATIISSSMSRNAQNFVVALEKERLDPKTKKAVDTNIGKYYVSDSETGGVALAASILGIPYIAVKVVEARVGQTTSLDEYLEVLKQYSFVGKAVISFIDAISTNDIEKMEE